MGEETECRLDTACRCLELPRPSKDLYLNMKDDEVLRISSLFRSLADPNRIRIMEMLSKGPLYVCMIQYLLDGIKYSKLSYHLDVLKKEGVVDSERQGNFVLYSLTPKGRKLSEELHAITDKR
ncbi:MAG: winged helix-turn-helix transcriptional regulator [Candidatus Thermoplasmatota archaeon]|nr:winged helix-turn-helix transcriptional regulator [Candidatus Thermoplasmatota archaeon]